MIKSPVTANARAVRRQSLSVSKHQGQTGPTDLLLEGSQSTQVSNQVLASFLPDFVLSSFILYFFWHVLYVSMSFQIF